MGRRGNGWKVVTGESRSVLKDMFAGRKICSFDALICRVEGRESYT
jgi:hypothetical protein